MLFRLIILSTLVFPQACFSHSGGTDSNGCHSGSQPYHCHNDGEENSNSSAGIYHVAVATTAAFSIVSAYFDFQHPIYLSANQSGFGLGASFLDPNKVLYINSKFYSDESVISIGMIIFGSRNIDLYVGAGIYTEVIDFKNDEDEYEEENSFNLNLGLSKTFNDLNIFVDLDSGPKSLSLGIAKRI